MSLIPWQKTENSKWPSIVLGVLLIADILFILGHIFTVLFWGLEPKALLLDAKGFGYPEGFQYLKYLGVMGVIAYLIGRKKRYAYLPLFVLFVFLLADDVLQLHRKASWFFIHVFDLHTLLGIKASSMGLLAYTGTMVLFFFGLSVWHYITASKSTRKSFLDISVLLGVFLFFGVGLDLLHTFFEEHHRISLLLSLTEEGGEMLSLSILVWYFCRLAVTPQGLQGNLWTSLFTKCKLRNWQNNKAASF